MSGSWRSYVNAVIAAEINSLTRYCSNVIQLAKRESDSGALFECVEGKRKSLAATIDDIPEDFRAHDERGAILLNGNLNHDNDIEGLLRDMRRKLSRFSRVSIVTYNPYLRWLYHLANRLGLRQGEEPSTFLTQTDLRNITRLAGYEVTRIRPIGYCPWQLGGIGDLINRILPAIPLIRWCGLASVITLRPIMPATTPPSVTVVIPARNEKGNIENALKRMPKFGGAKVEVIYIEGHSKDETWEEIQRVLPLYQDQFSLAAYQQTGKGKSDAVRLGFGKANNELLMILDADLTMPPELLERFYDAYSKGLGDFINGSRLVYPMEGQAMKFLNRLGNIFFAKALSFVLQSDFGDTLCGTKVLSRIDYQRFCEWRKDFGDFDPFGDFELLFPAAILGLGVIDIPMRYRDRVYGSTNIRRFYHGWMLLKMTAIGLLRVRVGRGPSRLRIDTHHRNHDLTSDDLSNAKLK